MYDCERTVWYTVVALCITAIIISSVAINHRNEVRFIKGGYTRTTLPGSSATHWVRVRENGVTEQMVNNIANLSSYVTKDSQMTQRILGELNAINKALDNKRDKR